MGFSPLSCHSCLPVAASHTRTVLSLLPLASFVPSGDHATEPTKSEWPLRGDPMGAPVDASHSSTVLSKLPLASRVPSGLHETDMTLWSCPLIVDNRPPSSKFHSLMLLSAEQEATTLSSGWNATPVTVLPDSDRQQPSLTHRHTDAQWNSKHGCVLGHDRNDQS